MLRKQDNGDFVFANARRNIWGTIDCDVTIDDTGEVIRFTATPDDDVEYGRELYNQLDTTYSSEVGECPEEERYEAFSRMARYDRNDLLKQSDWTQQPDVPEATRALWITYRQALRDVPAQTGFPYEITWPTPPA